jgi:hypothetical protein
LPSDEEVCDEERQQTIFESRDPDRLLSALEEIYSVLIERLCNVQMDSSREVVPLSEKELNGHSDSPEMECSSADNSESVQMENKMSESGQDNENSAEKEVLESVTSAQNGNLSQEVDLITPCEADDNKQQEIHDNLTPKSDVIVTENKTMIERIAFLEEEIGKLFFPIT